MCLHSGAAPSDSRIILALSPSSHRFDLDFPSVQRAAPLPESPAPPCLIRSWLHKELFRWVSISLSLFRTSWGSADRCLAVNERLECKSCPALTITNVSSRILLVCFTAHAPAELKTHVGKFVQQLHFKKIKIKSAVLMFSYTCNTYSLCRPIWYIVWI